MKNWLHFTFDEKRDKDKWTSLTRMSKGNKSSNFAFAGISQASKLEQVNQRYLWQGLKGHCHEHRFKNSRFQKDILQQWKPTNTGPVLIKITMPDGVMKLKKSSIIVTPPWAQDPNFKKSAWFSKFCHRDSVPLKSHFTLPLSDLWQTSEEYCCWPQSKIAFATIKVCQRSGSLYQLWIRCKVFVKDSFSCRYNFPGDWALSVLTYMYRFPMMVVSTTTLKLSNFYTLYTLHKAI